MASDEHPTLSEVELFRTLANKERLDTDRLNEFNDLDPANQHVSEAFDLDDDPDEEVYEMSEHPQKSEGPSEPSAPPPANPEIEPSEQTVSLREPGYIPSRLDLNQEKRMLLAEYKLLKEQHPTVVRSVNLTEANDYEEIQLTLLQARNAIEVSQGAEMLIDGLKIVCTGIEWMAPRVTKDFIKLDGWSQEVSRDAATRKYDAVMQAIYRRYWRNYDIMSSPISQLGMRLATSAGLYAFRQRTSMGSMPSTSEPAQPPPPTPAAMPFQSQASGRMRGPRPPQDEPQVNVDPSNILRGLDLNNIANMANLARAMQT